MSARRTCVVCRGEADRDDLVRIVLAPDGRPLIDYRGRLPGRGAWLHPTRACLAGLDNRALSRTFKAKLSSEGLVDQLREAVERAVLDGLSHAAAAGLLLAGFDVVLRSLQASNAAFVVLASDTAERTSKGVREVLGDTPCAVVPFDRELLGHRIGRAPVAVLGVLTGDASRHLRRQLRRLLDLG